LDRRHAAVIGVVLANGRPVHPRSALHSVQPRPVQALASAPPPTTSRRRFPCSVFSNTSRAAFVGVRSTSTVSHDRRRGRSLLFLTSKAARPAPHFLKSRFSCGPVLPGPFYTHHSAPAPPPPPRPYIPATRKNLRRVSSRNSSTPSK
jgi:hypothetical protein